MTDRLRRLREAAAALGADAAIVTHPANRHYFSGFPAGDHAPDESSGVLVVAEETAILYTSPTNLPWAESAVRAAGDGPSLEQTLAGVPRSGTASPGGSLRRVRGSRALGRRSRGHPASSGKHSRSFQSDNAFHVLRAVKSDQELTSDCRSGANHRCGVRRSDGEPASPASPRKRWPGASRSRCASSARTVPASRSSSPPAHTAPARITTRAIARLRKASRS